MGSTISPCIVEAEKREKKSAAKRRKSTMLAFTLTPGAGPGQEGQVILVVCRCNDSEISGARRPPPRATPTFDFCGLTPE